MHTTTTSFDSPAQKAKRNLARANGYLRRKEFSKAVDAARTAFTLKPKCRNLFGQQKHELEFMFIEFCDNFNANPGVIAFLESIKIRMKPFLVYKAGQEQNVLTKLDIVAERWDSKKREKAEQRAQKALETKRTLIANGQRCLDKGEFPRGRSYLRRAAEEFGHEEGLLTDIAKRLMEKDLLPEAAEMLEEAREKFPRDHTTYSLSVKAYLELGEMAKAEKVYKAAIRTFGGHPQTYLNMSKFYAKWRKRDKAWEFAKLALEADPALQEAREIMRKNG